MRTIRETAARETTAGRGDRPRALLVGDAEERRVAERAGFEVVIADPERAVPLLAECAPDVVVVASGRSDESQERSLGLVRAIRAFAPRAAIPLVVIAPRLSAELSERAYEAGATDVWMEGLGPVVWSRRLPFVIGAARAMEEIARRTQKLDRARRLAGLATWEWQPSDDRIVCSDELKGLLCPDGTEEGAGLEFLLSLVHPSDRSRVAQEIAEAVKERRAFRFDHRALGPDGVERILRQEGDVVPGGPGEAVTVEAVVMDVSEMKRAELLIHSLANYDRLTGLLNRLSFLDRLEDARALQERRRGTIAVALLDVDRFKEVNESLGQRIGDQLLKELAGRLLGSIRKGDFVAREGDAFLRTVARRGGDEFLMMLTDVEQAHDAARAARRVLESLRRPFRVEDNEIFVTASMGVAISAGASTEELLRQAEIAMYSAKQEGRNRFLFFDESMNRAVLERFEVETHLRRALARRELVLHYQPLVKARTRELVGVEALVRWHHPRRGLLSADEFVPLAEETGLIVPIGRWVLRTACQQLRQWRERGLGWLRLSANLSPRELRAPGFVASLAKILEETETDPAQIELELTERGVMANDRRTLEVLFRLKEIGVRLAVDDFGTGHTTLRYLKDFPLTTIKIDKAFTRDIARDGKDAAITRALLAMAHRLQLNVVAEGVENEAQLSFLGENDCDEVQGFLFGKPAPADAVESLLREQGAPDF